MELRSMVSDLRDGPKEPPQGGVRPILRRRTIYVEGYDPMGAKGYFSLFRRTYDQFKQLWPISITLQPLEIDSEDLAHWSVEIHGNNWQSTTRYDFLRLERFIRSDMEKPTLFQVLRGLNWYVGDILSGTEYRIFRAAWRFALHLLVFQSLMVAWVAIATAAAVAVGYAITRYFDWSALPAAAVAITTALLVLHALRPFADRLRVIQINSCWATLRKFARGLPTWLDYAIDVGARHVLAAANVGDVDELAIVGHSAGGVTATAIMARALELDPDLGRRGPQVVLVTLGSVMPAAALHPAAARMRAIVERLTCAPNLIWIDCQSRKDIMCFANFDPVDGIGIRVSERRCNPVLWRIAFKDMISPAEYRRFRRNFFRMHYQYLMAGDRPAPYDYILLTAGPTPIVEWPRRDRQLMAALSQTGTSGSAPRHDDIAVGASP
jgi:hypothetical protein